jgi:site-specific recombinase XerD
MTKPEPPPGFSSPEQRLPPKCEVVIFQAGPITTRSAEVLDLLRDGGAVAHSAVIAKRRAQTDEQLITAFLRSRTVRASSREAYARYLRQHLYFTVMRAQVRSVRLLQTEHWDRLIRWMRFPRIADVMATSSAGLTDPNWRPLRGRSNDATITLALSVIQRFHAWLQTQGVMVFDPFADMKATHLPDASLQEEEALLEADQQAFEKNDPALRLFDPGAPNRPGDSAAAADTPDIGQQLDEGEDDPIMKLLSPEAIALAFRVVDAYPQETPEQRRRCARDRWALVLAFSTGMRAAEMARVRARTLKLHTGKDHRPYATLAVRRKGRKVKSRLPIPDFALTALEAQYQMFGISLAAAIASDLPLVLPVRGVGRHPGTGQWAVKALDRKQVWWLFDQVFRKATLLAQESGWDEEHWKPLAMASTHWARHTFGTTVSNLTQNNIVAAQLALGHTKPTTTAEVYVHVTDEQLRKEMERAGAHLIPGVGPIC